MERNRKPGSPRRMPRFLITLLLAWAGTAAAQPVARDDRVVLRENASPTTIAVIANDVVDAEAMEDGELRISSPPLGEAVIDTRGSTDAGDDRIAYVPPADFSGEDVLSYQVCEGGGTCAEAQLHLTVRPSTDVMVDTITGSGFADLELSRLRDLPDVMFRATPLAVPFVDERELTVDATPEDPWDAGGTAVVVHELPAPVDGLPKRWRVLVDGRGLLGNIDVYLGVDANGDDLPDVGEVQCTAAMTNEIERCELAITHPGTGPVRWWALLHNRSIAPQGARTESFQVHLDTATDGTLVATGPGDVPAVLDFPVRLAWTDSTLIAGDARAGYVRVVSADEEIGVFPVRVDRIGDEPPATMLGFSPMALRLPGLGDHDRLFVDVPAGATSLTVQTASTSNIDVYLIHATPGIEAPIVLPAPPRASAAASGTGPTGSESVTVTGAALLPGRWYVEPVNVGDQPADLTIQAFVDGVAPIVRSGSYFNPDRSGHGIFLYPAADQWTGLWYTYFQDRTPTWYYLQGTQPGADGIWSSELFRAAWDGNSRELVSVGRVLLTPSGPDTFTWSYRIDGETGSETLVALGRGCPMLDGDVVDSSSTWFDPDAVGTGYSVQYFDDYEYYAAFVYDAIGVPRFLTAERTSFGDADELFDLEQLRGFCPLCVRGGDPERETIGAFGRSFDSEGQLETIALAGLFTDGVDGTWDAEDEVQPLGGPGTTQGCDP